MTDDSGRVSALESALASAQSALAAARAEHQATLNEVGVLAQRVKELASALRALKNEFSQFVEEDHLARNMQFAQTALIDVRAQRDRQFGHYASVRRGTIGMLQAMDAGIVTESALRQAAEKLMIETPGYWLAPAQVALAAWISDSEELARRALLEAMSRDPDKTSLFFSLVLARHERYGATSQWIYEYVTRQDPRALSREFTVVLDAVAQGALGGRALQLIRERCVTWYEQLRSAEEIVTEQAQRWLQRMSQNQRNLSDEFAVLPGISPDWKNIARWLETATAHEQTEQWLRGQLEMRLVRQDGLRERVDGVLRNLVTAYDKDEDSLRRQEMKWAKVIESSGDHALAAQAQEDDSLAEEPPSDFLTLLSTIGITPEIAGASIPTQQLAIRLANEWICTAAADLSSKSRRDKPPAIAVRIEGWRGELTSQGNEEEAASDFNRFIDKKIENEVLNITNRDSARAFLISLTVFTVSLLSLLLHWLPNILVLIVGAIALVALGVFGVQFGRSFQVLPERRDEARKKGEARRKAGLVHLRQAASEARKAFHLWETELAKESSLIDFIHEQAAHTDSLPIPAIGDRISSSETVETLGTTADIQGDVIPTSRQATVSDHSFAFRLPDWDLLPPPHATPK